MYINWLEILVWKIILWKVWFQHSVSQSCCRAEDLDLLRKFKSQQYEGHGVGHDPVISRLETESFRYWIFNEFLASEFVPFRHFIYNKFNTALVYSVSVLNTTCDWSQMVTSRASRKSQLHMEEPGLYWTIWRKTMKGWKANGVYIVKVFPYIQHYILRFLRFIMIYPSPHKLRAR